MSLSIQTLRFPPEDSEFTPLKEHQSFTPASYSLEENPVLYFKKSPARVEVSDELVQIPNEKLLIGDIYVTSSYLLLWFSSHSIGLSIPYQFITLHAIQSGGESIYLQIESEGLVKREGEGKGEGEGDFIEFTISIDQSEVQELYNALSECSSLHPDQNEDEDDIGFDDNEGWITAESLVSGQGDDDVKVSNEGGEHENGHSHGPSAALEVTVDDVIKAGQRRNRGDEVDDEGEDDDGDEAKWRRTA